MSLSFFRKFMFCFCIFMSVLAAEKPKSVKVKSVSGEIILNKAFGNPNLHKNKGEHVIFVTDDPVPILNLELLNRDKFFEDKRAYFDAKYVLNPLEFTFTYLDTQGKPYVVLSKKRGDATLEYSQKNKRTQKIKNLSGPLILFSTKGAVNVSDFKVLDILQTDDELLILLEFKNASGMLNKNDEKYNRVVIRVRKNKSGYKLLGWIFLDNQNRVNMISLDV